MEDKYFSKHEEGGRVSNFTIKGEQLTTVVVLKVYAVASPHRVGGKGQFGPRWLIGYIVP